jgi:hypothetical protein
MMKPSVMNIADVRTFKFGMCEAFDDDSSKILISPLCRKAATGMHRGIGPEMNFLPLYDIASLGDKSEFPQAGT